MADPDDTHIPPEPETLDLEETFDLEEAFDRVRRLADPAAREAFVARLESEVNRSELRALLDADARAGRRLEVLAEDTTAPFLPRLHRKGDTVGSFELVEPLGEGGFGEVWRARQTDPVTRDVALKLIKPGMDSRTVVRRFEAERRTLASMDHPHIARVLDAGVTDRGHPYFAMELVDGQPIVDYCDRHHLRTADRLEIFTIVCRAIQHAHQKGVIHRDIKPSNVLVAKHDGTPVPKVIDFGIAHILEGEASALTRFTVDGQLVGTPGYMSPEQASGASESVDTRSDVYSLGVLLYELLVGKPPFEPEDLVRAGLGEMLRIVREVDPPRPSTRFETLGDASEAVAAARGSSSRRVRLELQGELDWIVMKCLEKEPARRYDGANALADEIDRALRNEPVIAGPPSVVYRARRFVRRNRGFVVAATALTAALLLGTLGTAIGFVRADAGWRTARVNEQAALSATAEAQRTLYGALGRLVSGAISDGDHEGARRLLDRTPPEYRGWEHAHFAARLASDGWGLGGLTGGRYAPTILSAPAHRRIYGVGQRNLVAWDALTGAVLFSVALNSSGKLAVTADESEVIVIGRDVDVHDAVTGRHLRTLPTVQGSVGGTVPSVIGDTLTLSVWREDRQHLVVMDRRSGAQRSVYSVDAFRRLAGGGSACAVSPDGRTAAFSVPGRPSDGATAVAAPELHIVRIVDGVRLEPHGVRGAPIGFVSNDRVLVQWRDKPAMVVVGQSEEVQSITEVGVAGKRFAAGPGWIAAVQTDGAIRTKALGTGRVYTVHPGRGYPGNCVVDLAAGRLVASWTNEVRMYDLGRSGDPSVLVRGDHGVRLVEPLPGGQSVVTADWSGWFDAQSGSLSMRDALTGEVLASLLGPFEAVQDLVVHPVEPLIVASVVDPSEGKMFRAYDCTTGQMLWQDPQGGFFESLAIGPDGRVVTVSEPGEMAAVRDARSGAILASMSIPPEDAMWAPLVVAPDRVLLVSLARNEQRLVDMDLRLIRMHTMPLDLGNEIRSSDVHPDGRMVALPRGVRRSVTIFDAIDGRIVADVGPHGGIVRTARFSPDGARLFTGCDDGLIRIFDTDRFDLVGTLAGHEGVVRHLVFMPDGRTLLSAGGDGTVRRWGLETRTEHLELIEASETEAAAVDAWLELATRDADDRAAVLARIEAHAEFDAEQRALARRRLARFIPFPVVPADS